MCRFVIRSRLLPRDETELGREVAPAPEAPHRRREGLGGHRRDRAYNRHGLQAGDSQGRTVGRLATNTVLYTGIFMFIVMLASAFGWILIREQVGRIIFGPGLGLEYGYWGALFLILVGIIIIGCFMETISALALIVPVLAPVVLVIGIDPVHLGVIVVFGLQVGLITPPIGMAMYFVSAIAGITIWKFVRTVLPFLVGMIILLILAAIFPELSLAMPRLIFG
jgi:TRAP-type C4-dicarboxylate transport system permease large subunit